MALLNDFPRQQLREIIGSYDQSLWGDPIRCKSLLLDLCSGYQREIAVLMAVLEENGVTALQQSSVSQEPYESLQSRLARLLYEDRGLAEDFAAWGVDSWALALGVVSEQTLATLFEVPEHPVVEKKVPPVKERGVGECKQVIVVSQQGNGQYTTISEAVKNASPGTCIYVEPGRYKERIDITKNLRILGRGLAEKIIVESYESVCVRMRGSGFAEVRGLTINGHSAKYDTVDINRGQLTLRDCTITSDAKACISISGELANPTIRDCLIRYSRGRGVETSRGSQGTIEVCHIESSGLRERERDTNLPETSLGVFIKDRSAPIFRKCEINYQKGYGVLVEDNGEKTMLENCSVFGDRSMEHNSKPGDSVSLGVEIGKNSHISISGGQIYGSRGNGVFIHDDGMATIQGCKIFENALAGVKIQQKDSEISIQSCEIYNGSGSGILILGKGEGKTTIENCHISGNAHAGIEIRHDGNHEIRRCNIYKGKGWGILCCGNGKITIEKCTIYENAYHGVEIKSGSILLKETWIDHNAYYGITVEEQGKAVLDKCGLRANTYGMWPVRDKKRIEFENDQSGLSDRLLHFTHLRRLKYR